MSSHFLINIFLWQNPGAHSKGNLNMAPKGTAKEGIQSRLAKRSPQCMSILKDMSYDVLKHCPVNSFGFTAHAFADGSVL